MITHTTFQLAEHISCLSANHETDRPVLAAICGSRSTLAVEKGGAQEMQVREAPAQFMGRSLNEDALKTIQYFMNGFLGER